MKVYFSFEELSLIEAIGGGKENVIARLSEIRDNTDDDDLGIAEVISSAIKKLKSISDDDFAALEYSETEGDYAR